MEPKPIKHVLTAILDKPRIRRSIGPDSYVACMIQGTPFGGFPDHAYALTGTESSKVHSAGQVEHKSELNSLLAVMQ